MEGQKNPARGKAGIPTHLGLNTYSIWPVFRKFKLHRKHRDGTQKSAQNLFGAFPVECVDEYPGGCLLEARQEYTLDLSIWQVFRK